jgi:hypothetical protein
LASGEVVTWLQMRLKKKHGGCDLGIQEDIAWASFVSSFEENIGSVVQLRPDIFPIGEVGQLYADVSHMAPSVRCYTTEGPDNEPVPPPSTEAEREKKPPAHILSGAGEDQDSRPRDLLI